MSVTTVRVSSPAEMVGVVQSMLGYVPSRSVVLLGLAPREDGKDHVVVGAVVGLDDLSEDDAAAWAVAFDKMERAGASLMSVFVYEDDHGDGARILPGFSQAMAGRALRLGDMVRVIDGRAYTEHDIHADGFLGEGVPVPTGADLPAVAPLVAMGMPAPAGSLMELIEAYRPGSAPRDRVAEIEKACQELEGSDRVAEPVAGLAMVLDLTSGPAEKIPPQALAAAVVALNCPDVRDGALKWLLPDFMNDGDAGDLFAYALTSVIGRAGFHPEDAEEAWAMRERLRLLLTHCPRQRSAQVAALVGAYLWRIGDGVTARRVWEAAQDIEPDSVLLMLFLTVLGQGMRYPS